MSEPTNLPAQNAVNVATPGALSTEPPSAPGVCHTYEGARAELWARHWMPVISELLKYLWPLNDRAFGPDEVIAELRRRSEAR